MTNGWIDLGIRISCYWVHKNRDWQNGKKREKENCNSANPYQKTILRFREGNVRYCGLALKQRKSAFCLCLSESGIKIDHDPWLSPCQISIPKWVRLIARSIRFYCFFFLITVNSKIFLIRSLAYICILCVFGSVQ